MDDVTLSVGGNKISGWDQISVTLLIEGCPSHFDISLTERYPGEATALVIQPGDPCTVDIGGDLVITGYVDRFHPSISPERHTIRVTGRGKCQDLVDCAAEWPNGQISGSSALQIAQMLAEPYGITVNATDDDVGPQIPQFNLNLGESAYEIIERICRYRALLAYELPDGSLFLTRVSSTQAGGALVEGQNIEEASIEYSMDARYSEYAALLQSVDVFGDVGDGGNLLETVYDTAVPRHRRKLLITEAGGGGADVCKQRALWEAARRAGRAYRLMVTVDSWRDSSGALWAPNTLVPIVLPSLKLPDYDWMVGSVTYRQGEEGTHADLVLMPSAAFQPEPVLLAPFYADVPAGGGAG